MNRSTISFPINSLSIYLYVCIFVLDCSFSSFMVTLDILSIISDCVTSSFMATSISILGCLSWIVLSAHLWAVHYYYTGGVL